ncbi:glycosyltransferase family 20-domain-containing protein [Radiomyces spectabilis]|uniref:glycosyltransferase family 20-domain-containing protein n=1 Tax=Radiomyces spectabilis TaxID=64574 RepID=UPI00221E7D51|nr:glycosyltransferase family 20-domain-containing protein [Radiomyces spectabilis]KAI8374198.1 glycosyltransferase family 20-domain-containing protein [Radiomyces spectabilis]
MTQQANSPLTAEKVANYLPLAGASFKVPGRIIHVTHQIPYNIIKSADISEAREDPDPVNPDASLTETDDVAAAPVSKLARHHRRGKTLRAKFRAANWTVVQSRGHNALYAGLQSLSKDHETIHIGWTGPIQIEETKRCVQHEELSLLDKTKLDQLLWETGRIIPIFLDNKSRGHYEGYCKEVLWPLFHYLVWSNVTDGRAEKANWADYVAVNRQFADTIIAHYKHGDVINIHDYHLLLVPQMLREKIPDAAIGIFIHATFPSSEIFRCLTTRKQILEGMLGANLVGFQTYSYARHFISSCTRVLGCESTQVGVNVNGHMVSVGTFPIGIDADRVNKFRKEPGVLPKMNAIRDMYADKKIIIGRDKLDSTKGVVQKLHAFEKFLKDYPEWRNKVVLIQVTTPTTHSDRSKLETKVSEIISHINGVYGSLEFTPIHHYHQDIDRDEYYALLSVADVGLITSVRDGMNTTSLEYIICQHEKHGPLILSEFTGTAGSLSAALMVNPWDYAGVARALNDALSMTADEKQARHQQLYNHITLHSAAFWAESFVKQLVTTTQQLSLQSHSTPSLDKNKLLEAYKSSKKRLIFFDYDGTLTPIVSVPSDAVPSPEMLKSLQALCDDPRNEVWVVSGRDQDCLDNWLGSAVNRLGLSAEHGCFLKPAGAKEWTNILDDVDMSWQQGVTEIFDYYTERTQGSFVEHKKSSITWHYRMADAEYGAFQAKECQNHLENAVVSKLPVEILVGKKNLEVRPLSINKGEIVKRILSQRPDTDFVLCAGDDKTDEDMFRTLSAAHYVCVQQQMDKETSNTGLLTPPSSAQLWNQPNASLFSITVGPPEKKTMANWHVRTSHEVVDALSMLASVSSSLSASL